MQALGAAALLEPGATVVVVDVVAVTVQETAHGGVDAGLGGLPLLVLPRDAVGVGNAATRVAGRHLRTIRIQNLNDML